MIAKLFWLCVGSIGYAYAGYPIILTLLARLRPKPQPYPPATPSVTLLVAAHNEETVIAQKLENSLALDYPRRQLQIIVAADGSSDRTADIVRQYADQGIELSFSPPRRGKMAAINRAMQQARGEVVVFSDANNMYAADTLRALVAPFADPTVGAATGAKSILRGDGVLGESEGMYWKYESFIKKQETHLGSCTGVAGEILALRRRLFETPPDYVINDDFYMAMRVSKQGYRVVYIPQARSYERVSLSAQDEMTRRARIVAGRYQAIALAGDLLPRHNLLLVWQVVSHKFLRPLVPLAMIGALVTNLLSLEQATQKKGITLLSLAPPVNWLVLLGQMLFYGAAWLGNQLEDKNHKLAKVLYLPTFLVNSNLAALTGLYRFVSGGQATTWQRVNRRAEPAPVMSQPTYKNGIGHHPQESKVSSYL
ncbi:MAG: glycosyltransferase family 2 protein [Anaerolineae bacterium]|nr:glycosyltransferase family 2 protein [Anaerolineae bacterium]